ncbi:MAG TPA: GNAT family N-acyltransferase [Coriobacteriia bacterium]|nr:GNAT family N-acyltransferase [Coriobacteriia bacterium]
MQLITCTTPEQIVEAKRIRYQVYCLEKGWVDPATCPDGLESDEYDDDAVHFLVADHDSGRVLGSTRILLGSKVTLPAVKYLDPSLHGFAPSEVIEASRMASLPASRSQSHAIFLGLGQAMWEWAIDHEIGAWMALADAPVYRLMQLVGMPIIGSGKPVDYIGSMCIPCIVDTYACAAMFKARGFDARVA